MTYAGSLVNQGVRFGILAGMAHFAYCLVVNGLNSASTMKATVTRFKSLKVAIKELEPFIKNGSHIEIGKPFKRFCGLRSRELLANWLICVVAAAANGKDYTFTSDPYGGDGIIIDNTTSQTWPTEHILVPTRSSGTKVENLILQAIEQKNNKGGKAYASGKILVVFLNYSGRGWFPNTVARNLPKDLHFSQVWVISLQTVILGKYSYGVALLDLSQGNCPVWHVRIGKAFDSWRIKQIQ